MTIRSQPVITAARAQDAADLARLIDIAGEGIPAWLWGRAAGDGQTALDIGIARARREAGGFSYRNAHVARMGDGVAGMVLGYPIENAPEDDPDALPAPLAPFVALEKRSVGTWYVNALAVFPGDRDRGIGRALLGLAENRARHAGYDRVTLQVYQQNSGAVRLYEAMGYAEEARAAVRAHPCQPYYTGSVLLLSKATGRAGVSRRDRS